MFREDLRVVLLKARMALFVFFSYIIFTQQLLLRPLLI